MMVVRYCTKEWLDESARRYHESPQLEEALKKVTAKLFFRIKQKPDWGIEQDFIFGAVVEQGKLLTLAFFPEEEARTLADYILAAAPNDWKELLRKEKKFITEFLKGKVKLEQGSQPGLLKITPYANHFVDALTLIPVQFPDEMTAAELHSYREELFDHKS
jgi:hypothetical protein